MPLKVSQGIGAWIKDFKDSNAPQFKGKSDKERRDQAIAAYLSAKRGPQKEDAFSKGAVERGKVKTGPSKARLDAIQKQKDAEKKAVDATMRGFANLHKAMSKLRKDEMATHASADKKPEKYIGPDGKVKIRMVPVKVKQDEEIIRSKKSSAKLKRDASSRTTGSQEQREDFNFKVDIEGLPSLFMTGNSPGSVKSHLRKLVKQPSMVKDVQRVTRHDKKKELRKKSMEEEVPHNRDEGKPGSRKHAAKMTPGQVKENRRERLRAKLAAVGKDMKKTADELKKTTDDYNRRFMNTADKQNKKQQNEFIDTIKKSVGGMVQNYRAKRNIATPGKGTNVRRGAVPGKDGRSQ